MRCSREWSRMVVLFIGPRRERNGRPTGYGGCPFNGGWPLLGGEREAMGVDFPEGEATGR
jgi:hypothetical protein